MYCTLQNRFVALSKTKNDGKYNYIQSKFGRMLVSSALKKPALPTLLFNTVYIVRNINWKLPL